MSAPCSDRLDQIGRRQRVIDNQRHAGIARDGRDGLDVDDVVPAGLAIDSMKMALVAGVTACAKLAASSASAHTTFQPNFLKA